MTDIQPFYSVPTGNWSGIYPWKNFLLLLFSLSTHTPTLLRQRGVFHPTPLVLSMVNAGKTTGCLVVSPLRLCLCWCDMGHFLSPQVVTWATVEAQVGRKEKR